MFLTLGAILVLSLVHTSLQIPSASDWNGLNSTVNGRLVAGKPLALPCYSLTHPGLSAAQNARECGEAQDNYLNNPLRADTFGTYMNTQWETCQATGEQCLLDSNDPSNIAAFSPPQSCGLGSIPPVAIDVRSPADVLAAFFFAKSHDLPIVVKNSGHDFKGRSSGPNALAVWVHNLQGLSFNSRFTPRGCSAAQTFTAITMGAGVFAQDVLDFAHQHNTTILIGADPTIAYAGGYTQGGGHSALSSTFGLSADRALEFEVVTANGQHLFANACQNEDLFFALRGGGGGTFGVVLGMTTRALPQMSIAGGKYAINPTSSNQRAILSFMINNSLSLADANWGGVTAPQLGVALWANPVSDEASARASIQPLQEFVESLGGNFTFGFVPDYKTWFTEFEQDTPIGTAFTLTSRLVPASLLENAKGRATLFDAIEPSLEGAQGTYLFAQTPLKFNRTGDTGLNPAWYSSIWHLAMSTSWSSNSSTAAVKNAYQSLSAAIAPVRKITSPGAYINEADVYEPDFEASFWGSNYDRLLAIKDKYDPAHILDCWQCVGWLGQSNRRYKCYIPLSIPAV